jgi:ribonuclease-3
MSELVPPSDGEIVQACEQTIGYQFRNADFLRSALTHASGANTRLGSNERLEFLGDAILGAVVCDLLFQRFPAALEGELTRIKSVVVSRRTCTKLSRAMGLERFLVLGKGIRVQSPVPASVLADVFEAMVAAIYLDGGMEAAREFVLRHILAEVVRVEGGSHGGNYKSLLQQLAQRQFGITPAYQVLDEKGPDHCKCFKVAAQIGLRHYAPAWGRNKKDAEQRAAMNALNEIWGHQHEFEGD